MEEIGSKELVIKKNNFDEVLTRILSLKETSELVIEIKKKAISCLDDAEKLGQAILKQKDVKNLQISFEENGITLKQFVAVLKPIQDLKNLESLDLNFRETKFGPKGAKELSLILPKMQNLKHLYLDLWESQIEFEGLQYICQALHRFSSLETFYIDIDEFEIQDKGLPQVLKIVENNGKTLKELELNLQSNDLSEKEGNLIADSIQKLQNLSILRLNLENNDLGDGVIQIGKSLEKLKGLTILQLKIFENELSQGQVLPVLENISNLKNLKELTLDFSDIIFDEKSKDLPQNLAQLQEIKVVVLNLKIDQSEIVQNLVNNLDTLSKSLVSIILTLKNPKMPKQTQIDIKEQFQQFKQKRNLTLGIISF